MSTSRLISIFVSVAEMALLKSQLLGVYFQPRTSPAVACETNYLTFITLSASATHIAA